MEGWAKIFAEARGLGGYRGRVHTMGKVSGGSVAQSTAHDATPHLVQGNNISEPGTKWSTCHLYAALHIEQLGQGCSRGHVQWQRSV